METVVTGLFSALEIPKNVDATFFSNLLVVKKWNWDYKEFLAFQKEAQDFIAKNRSLKIFIFCNHPHLYTLGRGNERGVDSLVEFDSAGSELPFELHKIHRGGGITFHHPGQWIFYPIIAIKESYTLEDHMCWILKSVAKILKEDFKIEDVVTARKLMGIWCERKKLASIGVGVNRFVTEHGLALNLSFDSLAQNGIASISPCGMSSEVYSCVDAISPQPDSFNLLELFTEKFIANEIS